MAAPRIEVEFTQPVEKGDADVPRVWNIEVCLVGYRVPARDDVGSSDGGQRRAYDPPEFPAAIVGEHEAGAVDTLG